MDDKTQKERLEQELRFLKESFEAEVISKDEFEKGKGRIEKKLKDIENQEKEQKPENEEKAEDSKTEESAETKELQDSPKEEQKSKDEAENSEYFEHDQKTDEKEEVKEPAAEEPKTEIKKQKKENMLFRYAVVFIILALIVFFSYSFFNGTPPKDKEKTKYPSFTAACGSDSDCKQQGKIGLCLNLGTKDAKCEFKEIPKINVVVVNDIKNCFNCDTQRVLNILEGWFGAINSKEIEYGTDDGKSLAEKYNASLLPMYILDENIKKEPGFEQFKQAFAQKDSNYILRDDAAGSTFYIKRENIPNRLDFFIISGGESSAKAEKNLREFLDAFKEVKFEKHLSNDKFARELGIKAYPSFLVNNNVRFSGVHTAETIKDNFCKMNKLDGCEKSLSKSLV